MSARTVVRDQDATGATDPVGIFHIFPEDAEHEISQFCWCFPEKVDHDPSGRKLREPFFVHHMMKLGHA